MADWYKNAVQTLIKIYQTDQDLFTEVQLAVRHIQRNPTIGGYVKATYRVYIDPGLRFRIGYHYHPKAKELEIVVIHLV